MVGAVFPVRDPDPRVRLPRPERLRKIAGALRGEGNSGIGAKRDSKRLVARQVRQLGGKRFG